MPSTSLIGEENLSELSLSDSNYNNDSEEKSKDELFQSFEENSGDSNLIEELILTDAKIFNGIIVVEKYVDHLERSRLFNDWKRYSSTNGIFDRVKLASIVAQGLAEYLVDDIKLKISIAFLEGIVLNKIKCDARFMIDIKKKAMEKFHGKIARALEGALMAESYEAISDSTLEIQFHHLIKTETLRFVKHGPVIKVVTQSSDVQDVMNTIKAQNITIFDLARVIYFKAISGAKLLRSEKLLKRFFLEGSQNYIDKEILLPFQGIPISRCKEMLKELIVNTNKDENILTLKKLFNAGETIVNELWEYVPNLKNEFPLRYMPLLEALDELVVNTSDLKWSVKPVTNNYESHFNFLHHNVPLDNNIMIDGNTIYIRNQKGPFRKDIPVLNVNSVKASLYKTESIFNKPTPVVEKIVTKTADTTVDPYYWMTKKHKIISRTTSSVNTNESKKGIKKKEYLEYKDLLKKTKAMRRNIHDFGTEKVYLDDNDKTKCSLNYILSTKSSDDVFSKAKLIESDEVHQICAGCGFFIPQNMAIGCFGEKWHTEHLTCGACNKPLIDCTVVLHRGIPLCTPHYLAIKKLTCYQCREVIHSNQEAVYIEGGVYHKQHITTPGKKY